MKKILFLALTFLLSIGMTQAQTRNNKHQNRRATQQYQQQRIAHGIHSGRLTPREAARLEQRQARIQHQKRMARADGHITPQEHMRIRKHQKMASRQIYMKKHNRQRW